MATQAQAQYYLGKYDDRVAEILGMAVPPNLQVKVVSQQQIDKMNTGIANALAGTLDGVTYVSNKVSANDLPGVIAYELVHNLQHLPTDDPNYISNSEAMAQAVRVKLGLADKSTLSPLAAQYSKLTPSQFQAANAGLAQGTFTDVFAYSEQKGGSTVTPTGTAAPASTSATYTPLPPGVTGPLTQKEMDYYNHLGMLAIQLLSGTISPSDLSSSELHGLITFINNGTDGANYGVNSPAQAFQEGLTKLVTAAGWGTVTDGGLTLTDAGTAVANGGTTTNGKGGGTTDPNAIKWGNGTTTGPSKAQTEASYQSLLISWGLLAPGEKPGAFIQNLIDHGLKNQWSITQFQNEVYQSPAFQQEYPGIFNSDGTLKMTPEAYQQQSQQYVSYAQQAGIQIGPGKLSFLFRNDVSPAEFAQRAQNEATLESNKAYFNAFQDELKQKGLPPADKNSLFHLLNGEGNKQYQTLWNEATVRYSAEQAGLKFGNAQNAYTNLNEKLVAKVAGKGLTLDAETQGFQTLAQNLLTTLPMSEARTYGLTKGDLVQAAFGGKHQAAAIQKIKLVTATDDAYSEARAAPQTFSDQSGGLSIVGGEGRKAQSQ